MTEHGLEDIYPLTALQQGFLWHWLAGTESRLGVEQIGLVLRGPLRLDAYAEAWQQVVDRHPALRTAFAWEGLDEPVQIVYEHAKLTVEVRDWRHESPAERERLLDELRSSERQRGFDITSPPLVRIVVARLDEETYDVTWTYHHLILDGWSVAQAVSDAHALYDVVCGGPAPALPPAAPFRDYFVWLQTQDRADEQRFWRDALAGVDGSGTLQPQGVVRQPVRGAGDARVHRLRLPTRTTDTLRALARRHAVTFGVVVQGAWALLLSRHTGQDDVVFGTVVSGRPDDLPGVTGMLGMFINNLPVRVRVDGSARLGGWLQDLHARLIEVRRFEHTPPGKIQEWANVPARVALFDSLVVVQNNRADPALARPLHGGVWIAEAGGRGQLRTAYPLTLSAATNGPELDAELLYDPRRFDAASIDRLAGHFANLLDAMAAKPDGHLDELEMLSGEERRDLLARGPGRYVLDAHRRLLPVGVIGQLYVEDPAGSPRSDESSSSIPRPFADSPGARLYPTGKLAVHLPDGGTQVLGPPELQTTIGGLRIDVAEIERRLTDHPAVAAAHVTVQTRSPDGGAVGDAQLVADVVPVEGRVLSVDELRQFLRTILPDQFVPSVLRRVGEPPTGSARSGDAALEPRPATGAARDGVEARLVDIWERLLGVRPIGVHDNFFDLGGTSFAAARLLDRVQAAFERKLSLATLLLHPSVAQMAQALRGAEIPEGPVGILSFHPQGSSPPLFCAHGPFEYVLYYHHLAQHLGTDQPMYVLRWDLQGGERLEFETVEELAAAYIRTMRTIQPEGPYYLLGHSFGGYVAYEMARQLAAADQSVRFLGLLDTGVGDAHGGRGLRMLAERVHRWIYVFSRLTPEERRAQFYERLRRTYTPRPVDSAAARAAAVLAERYRPGLYPGRVTMFWAEYVPRPLGGAPDTRDAWSQLAADGLEVHPVPGDHVLIVAEPRVHRLGEVLRQQLTRAQRQRTRVGGGADVLVGSTNHHVQVAAG